MTHFSNNQVLVADLPDWEDIQFEKISPRYKFVVLVRYILFIVVFAAVCIGIFWLKGIALDSTYQLMLIGGFLFIFLLLILNLWSMRYWGYALREHDIVYRSGVFTKAIKIIPFKHIQHVDIKQGALSRLFTLSSIELHTAGVGEGLKISGIDLAKVKFIQEYISDKISLRKVDSTYE